MALDRITKSNFISPGDGPKFKVYDYWYNVLVDYLNGVSTTLESLATGITAFATGGQASATLLASRYNNVTTCATAGDSVKLPTAVTGAIYSIKNNGAASLNVFPNTDDCINALSANLSVAVPVNAEVKFVAKDATTWESDSETLVLTSPSTQKGQLVVRAADSAGETATTITNVSQAAARTYSIPDAGGNAYFVMDPSLDGKTLNLHENLVIAEGYDVTITAEDVAGSIVLDKQTLEIEGEQTATQLTKIVNLANAAATLSISGTSCAINQDVRSTASPTFVSLVNTGNVGTVGTGTVTAVESGDGRVHVTTLTLTNFIVGDMGSAAANKAIGNLIYTFPAGVHVHKVSYYSVGFVGAGTAKTPVVALGSAQGTGAIATLHATLPTADDYTAEAAITNITGTAKVIGPVGATAGVLTGISLNKAADAKTVYLNAACGWAADNVGNLVATGTVVLNWCTLA
jgi:hypothetical protein